MQDSVKGKRVFVGLSGGVDSAVAAALLKQAGAIVTSVFIKGWYPPGMPCTWAADRRDAMRVAAHLKIPFATLDASAEYKKSVIDYLLREYKAGRTPNPDVMCNRDVKFGAFYHYAKEQGADHIATGHYRDGDKDQSYFLWAVPKEVLSQTLFPLRGMKKDGVRALARHLKLPVAEKRDSQGICFLGDVSIKDFLRHEFGDNPAILHTLGERVEGGYVVGKNIETKSLIIRERRSEGPARPTIHFSNANWLAEPNGVIEAQHRYRGAMVAGRVEGDAFTPSVDLEEPVAPGQSIVFYARGALAGGGIIES